MDIFELGLWAGTEDSLATYLLQLRKLMVDTSFSELLANGGARPKQGAFAGMERDAQELPRLLTVADGVATIRIAGPLNNSSSWINEYIGATGYPEIRQALVHAATDPAIKSIVLDVASGGGAVSGMFDTADLITSIDKRAKPVTAFSDSAILSAAYALGSSARHITISKSAEAGSVGVLMVHQEMSKMMEKVGITPTVIRAGKYKALGNPYEPLSELAKEEMQASVDHSYGLFVQHVADHRGVTYQVADTKLAQGRVFPGERAREVGLVDAIGTFDEVIGKAQKAKSKEKIGGGIANDERPSQYGAHSEGTTLKNALTEAQLAALAEGGVAVDPEAAAAAAAEAAAKEAADKAAADKAAADQAEAEAKAAAEKADAEAKAGGVVAYLQGQLAEANTKITDLTIAARDAKAASDALVTSHAAMREITVASVDRLRVALGHPAGGAAAMTDAELLAAHSTLRTQFEGKFKAGGVAAVSAAASSDKESKATVDPVHQARIAATRHK
ncbi:Putative signal peptide peptidase SppA [Variovorax sp. PBS-H4]|uniref:S49 family peptidase n=1 Tax=Variovorax sp. PBS-H4 TaxID=434008 RepID=UPI001319AC28|nr:S49 family peptidase [Variovorax sp. PBS-H4]VTU32236.1 Putative signal peptide peptidase SppA [Variovorax sp. PBS-H4]